MNRSSKLIPYVIGLVVIMGLSGCTLGQAAASPTATPLDVNAVMTSAAATAFVQLTEIAGQASPTSEPTATSAPTSEPPTSTPAPIGTVDPLGQPVTPTTEAAGGLPAVNTSVAVATLPGPIATPTLMGLVSPAATAATTCYNSRFEADMTIPDGTVLKPYEKFVKIWRVANTGTCAWDEGFGITIWAGPAMDGVPAYYSPRDQIVQPGGVVDLVVEMRAPVEPGEYIAHWVMINDQQKTFGSDLVVYIKVVK